MFNVIGTDTYLQEITQWPKEYQEMAKKVPLQLANNPFVGDHLSYPFLREKRIKEKIIYYLIYKDLNLVLLVAVSGKKNQQATINHIKQKFDEFRVYAEKISRLVS